MSPQTSTASRLPPTVCVRSPNWVGDAVMATPAFRCIRKSLPGSRILLVARGAVADVVRGSPWFDRVISYGGKGMAGAGGLSLRRCVRELRRERCDLGFILPNSFSSALMLRLAGVRRRVGYARDARSLLLTDAVRRPTQGGRFQPTYMADYYLGLCEAVGLEPESRRTELTFDAQDELEARRLVQNAGVDCDKPLMLFHPGAAYGPSKLWPEQNWARLAEMLQGEFGAQVACIGAPAEGGLVRAIGASCRAPLLDLTACGIDLQLLKPVVRMSRLLATTDSGPRHYGVALGVPTVCIMGPTRPAYSASGLAHDHVARVEVDCGPCQRKVCSRDHRCMSLLSPQDVLEVCRRALETADGEGDD